MGINNGSLEFTNVQWVFCISKERTLTVSGIVWVIALLTMLFQGNIFEQIFQISFILEMINTVPFIITVSV